MDATAIRAELDHSVVDADGHIIEYVPALRDLIGDDAGGELADRFTAHGHVVGAAPRPRRRDPPGQRPVAHRLVGRARPQHPRPGHRHAPRPALRTPRRAGHRRRRALPDRRPVGHGDRRRRAAPRPRPGLQPLLRRGLRAVLRPADHRRGHPDLRPRRGHRRARPRHRRARAQGLPLRRPGAAPGAGPRGRPHRPLGRRPRPRQRPRLRPGVAALRRARRLPHLPLHRHRLRQPGVAHQLRRQPHRQLRRRHRGRVPVAVLRRGDDPLPRAALRLPRGRRGLGVQPARRPGEPLREAQHRRPRPLRPAEPRPGPARRAHGPLRRRASSPSAATASTRPSASCPTPTRTRRRSTSGRRAASARSPTS